MSGVKNIFPSDMLAKFRILEVGYTEDSVATSYENFSDWIDKGNHAGMSYLADERKDKRRDIKNYFPNFKSAFVFLFDYRREKLEALNHFNSDKSNGLKIGAYTLYDGGADYHLEIKKKLAKLSEHLLTKRPDLKYLLSLDTQPILERDLAYRAGLGWFGKNSMLINKKYGSYFLIGSILCDQSFSFQTKFIDSDHCGSCLACIDACPTNAIDLITRTVDSKLCIPYYTIEMFNELSPPPKGYEKMDEIFGCDICQDVCPWNSKPLFERSLGVNDNETSNSVREFFLEQSRESILSELKIMSKKGYKRKFKNTSFERTGRDGLIKNITNKK